MSNPISPTCPISWSAFEDLALNNLDLDLNYLFKQAKLSPRDYPAEYSDLKYKIMKAKEQHNKNRGVHVFRAE